MAAAPVVAISYELWQRRYGANPSVLGRVLTIRGQAATIVAVMPRGFGFPAQTEVCGMTASAETFDDDLLGDVRPVILLLLLASGAGQPWKPRAADHHAGQQCRAGFIERAHEPQAVRAASLDRGPIRRVNPAELPRRRRFSEIGVVTLRARRQSANPMT